MNVWGAFVIALAVGLVAACALTKMCDVQTLTAVVGFASGIVTGTFGIMTGRSGRNQTERRDK